MPCLKRQMPSLTRETPSLTRETPPLTRETPPLTREEGCLNRGSQVPNMLSYHDLRHVASGQANHSAIHYPEVCGKVWAEYLTFHPPSVRTKIQM
jgi:hypothetical protein